MKNLGKLTLLFVLISLLTFAQTKDKQSDLNKKNNETKEELKKLKDYEKTIKLDKQKTQLAMFITSKKIEAREKLINNYNHEIRLVNRDIDAQQSVVRKLEKDLNNLKVQYTRMLRYAYKTRKSTDKLLFILSANSFNTAYKRWKYLRDLNKFRQKQVELIASKREQIKGEVVKLEEIKAGKQALLSTENQEKQKLSSEKKEKEALYDELKKKQEEIKKEIKEKKKEADKRDAEISRIIAEEQKKASTKTGGAVTLTPKEKELSQNFAGNQKKFPWPVEKYVAVSQTFGDHKHPVLETVMIHNNGIDMVVPKGTKARAIFKGTVTAVLVLPGDKYAVLIKHGEYYTMYSNLDVVSVKKGDEVETKGEIGIVKTNSEDGKTELHFEIWKANVVMDPQLWLSK